MDLGGEASILEGPHGKNVRKDTAGSVSESPRAGLHLLTEGRGTRRPFFRRYVARL